MVFPAVAMRNVKCIAHISGGGIPGKFAKDILFPRGLSADLTDLYTPADIMSNVVRWRGMTDRMAYETFHGGQRVLAVLPEEEVSKFIGFAGQFNIKAKRCGVIRAGEGRPTLHILSKFSKQDLSYVQTSEDP